MLPTDIRKGNLLGEVSVAYILVSCIRDSYNAVSQGIAPGLPRRESRMTVLNSGSTSDIRLSMPKQHDSIMLPDGTAYEMNFN